MPGFVRFALWLGGTAPVMTRPYVALMGRMVKNPDSVAKGIGSLLPEDELALMLGGNLARVFGFDTDKLAALAARIGPPKSDFVTTS